MVNKFIKVVLTISLFITSISIFYKFVVEPIQKERRLIRCLAAVEEKHSREWNKSCKALGMEDECGLSKDIAGTLLTAYDRKRDGCYQRYK